jgi:hypothetical protein
MRASVKRFVAAAGVGLLCLSAAGCSKVSGHTFAGAGGLVKIEFASGGKATTSMGPMSSACTYTESGSKITLVCEDDTTVFSVADDGSLNGPPDGMLAHLTKVK